MTDPISFARTFPETFDNCGIDRLQSSAERGATRLIALQDSAGRWEGEVVWCPVITAQVVLAYAIMGRPIAAERARLILRHFARIRRPDGGWGLHPESRSYLFVTALVYVAARLLGEAPGSRLLAPAAAWLSRHEEGLDALPTWGRFWLVLLDLYDPGRVTVCPPELFLLPAWLPIAPDRLYCHTRYIYLGMAYLSVIGLRTDLGDTGDALKRELADFTRPGTRKRHQIAATDVHVAPGRGLRLAYGIMATLGPIWRRVPGAAALRHKALARCLRRIRAEQRATCFQALSPVNGILNTLSLWVHHWQPGNGESGAAGPRKDRAAEAEARKAEASEVEASIAGLESWCWCDEMDGLRYAGARSTTWDTAFALQSLVEAPESGPDRVAAIRSAYSALAALQVTSTPPGLDEGRQDPAGGWCFGEPTHAWPVSDCTAEAVSALLLCHCSPGLIPPEARVPAGRLADAFRFLLARQNPDGGFATYERRRGGARLERLNPSEMFGDCMTERSYIECTASSIRALRHVPDLPEGTLTEAEQATCADAMIRARDFLLREQHPDGSWPGFWGINFIYATGLAMAALRHAGLPTEHSAVRRAIAWMTSVQQPDGGWGEHFSGCLTGHYVPNASSLVIMTAWAVLSLLRTTNAITPEARRGLDWLAARQLPNGDWPRDSVNGVFFGTAMLDYRLYNTYFPSWALNLAGTIALSRER